MPFHEHAPPLQVGLLGVQAIVLVTISLTAWSCNRVACNTGEEVDFMVEFGTEFSYSTPAVKQRLQAHFRVFVPI